MCVRAQMLGVIQGEECGHCAFYVFVTNTRGRWSREKERERRRERRGERERDLSDPVTGVS